MPGEQTSKFCRVLNTDLNFIPCICGASSVSRGYMVYICCLVVFLVLCLLVIFMFSILLYVVLFIFIICTPPSLVIVRIVFSQLL